MKIGKEKIFKGIGLFLLVFFAIFAFVNANEQSFWADELATIGFVREGISVWDMLEIYLVSETNLPLYSLFFYVIYRIMPYGDAYLLLPSILFVCFAIVMLAKCIYLITSDENAGFIALCLGCASNTVIWQGVWEIRCYGMLFFLSALVLYYYIKCYKEPCKGNYVRYSISVFLFMWTHWFAGLVLFIYGLADLFLLFKKKTTISKLFSYIPTVITIFPWLIISFISKQSEITDFWTSVPEWRNMFWTILFYLSGRKLLVYIFWIAVFAIFVNVIVSLKKGEFFENYQNYIWLLIFVTAVGTIAVVFVYSYFINPNGSMYVERYFMVIAPHILLIAAYGFRVLRIGAKVLVSKYKYGNIVEAFVKISLFITLVYSFVMCYRDSYISIRKPFEEYETAAELLINDGGVWEQESVFIGSNKACMLDGFVDYYFRKQGYPLPLNVLDGGNHNLVENKLMQHYSQISKQELLEYNKIYILNIHMECDDELVEFIEENYRMENSSLNEYGIEVWEKVNG